MHARQKVLFGTPLILAKLRDEARDAALERAVLAQRAQEPSSTRYNRGGWQSDMRLLDWGGDGARQLAVQVLDLADAHSVDRRCEAGAPHPWRVEAWANVSGRGASHLPHAHFGSAGSFWSAVYFLKGASGMGGELVLYDPRRSMVPMHAPTMWFKDAGLERHARIAPEEGLLVMFPSWLVHRVEPWRGEDFRISIAINLAAQTRHRAGTIEAASLREAVERTAYSQNDE